MEDEPINKNYLIGCDTIENSPSICYNRVRKRRNSIEIQKSIL